VLRVVARVSDAVGTGDPDRVTDYPRVIDCRVPVAPVDAVCDAPLLPDNDGRAGPAVPIAPLDAVWDDSAGFVCVLVVAPDLIPVGITICFVFHTARPRGKPRRGTIRPRRSSGHWGENGPLPQKKTPLLRAAQPSGRWRERNGSCSNS
jgi:hypothetical protein